MTKYIYIICFLLFCGCSTVTENRQTLDKIQGTWVLDSIHYGPIHACFRLPLKDIKTMPQCRLNNDFTVDFRPDSTFRLVDSNKILTGKYVFNDSTLILNDSDKRKIYKFLVDSLKQNEIYLYCNYVLFYTITGDSLDYFTGDKTKIKLKKK
jgi:hypothetical protein